MTLRVTAEAVEAVSDALVDTLDARSASIEDADAGTAAEQPVFDEPGIGGGGAWRMALVNALFDSDAEAHAAATRLRSMPFAAAIEVVGVSVVDERDWVRLTQAQFGPIEIDRAFWIVPSWSAVPAAAQRVIRLDPGLAFGTGGHATTRMCLRWITAQHQLHRPPSLRALDYGCGSGVLGIALALHGAATVDAVDIDPAAVAATAANASANAVSLRSGGVDDVRPPYDLVIANILATPLKLLAPLLCCLLAESGELLLSGILERQVDELVTTYAPWLPLRVADRDDGWVLLHGRLPPLEPI
ncbi:MAG: 50S ribosomal protein L11 methyltransferase [Pseudomonadota bacterium]|nr:50S ribosomal protein L11 methyltransferase [Pseudomonadota bacterium]